MKCRYCGQREDVSGVCDECLKKYEGKSKIQINNYSTKTSRIYTVKKAH